MPATRTSLLTPEADGGMRLWLWIAALALPLLGLVLLLAAPDADVQWEHHPSHFWLVLAAGVTSAALAFSTSAVALRRSDARLYLVSLAFLSAAGFLGLHALSPPGVLLDTPNQGFAVATPIGLLLSSLFAAASALPLRPERAGAVMRHAHLLRGVLLGAMAVWAAWSLLSVPPLDDPTPVERATGVLLVVPVVAVVLYAFAAARYLAMVLHSGSPILLGVTSAWVLLGEASVAVAFGRNWYASWWEWHLLMLVAFGAIAVVARREDAEERFSDLYLDHTAAGTREVSVLFADLAGFTSFSEGREPREVSEMLNAYFEAAIPPIVREHGGEIDRLIGDALMATWGTRGDQPDHVVGAESGRSYTVIGDTVNVAARLESRAPTGGVVVGGATLRAVPGMRATSLGEVEMKGRLERVDAYLLELRS